MKIGPSPPLTFAVNDIHELMDIIDSPTQKGPSLFLIHLASRKQTQSGEAAMSSIATFGKSVNHIQYSRVCITSCAAGVLHLAL